MQKHKDCQSEDNLKRYARLVWKIFLRNKEENKKDLKDEWEKRFDNEE